MAYGRIRPVGRLRVKFLFLSNFSKINIQYKKSSNISLKEAPTNSSKGTIPASDLNLSRKVAFYQNYMALIRRKGSQEQHFYQTLFGVN